jgi:hypothetical protein
LLRAARAARADAVPRAGDSAAGGGMRAPARAVVGPAARGSLGRRSWPRRGHWRVPPNK